MITTYATLSLSERAAVYFNIFSGELKTKLPFLIGEHAVKAGLPLTQAETFVATYMTASTQVAAIPGVNGPMLTGTVKGSQWAYAESLRYV